MKITENHENYHFLMNTRRCTTVRTMVGVYRGNGVVVSLSVFVSGWCPYPCFVSGLVSLPVGVSGLVSLPVGVSGLGFYLRIMDLFPDYGFISGLWI